MKPVYIDITEFIGNPIHTGIQRLVRAVLSHWPEEIDYVAVRYDRGQNRLRPIHPRAVRHAINLATSNHSDLSIALDKIELLDRNVYSSPVELDGSDCLLAPELFYDHSRVKFYRDMLQSGVAAHLIVPDFLVWLKPDTFPINSASSLMPYLQLLIECQGRAFISQAVQRTFEERILRDRDKTGIALDLGADSLSIEKQIFDPSKKILLCVGTLDGRKGQENVYRAFCERSRGDLLKLIFLGRVPPAVSPKVEALLANTRSDVELITSASDAVIAEYFRQARATVYTSPAEGYGLPPMESLFAGIPVVVHRDLPALEGKPTSGQIRLDDSSPAAIRNAIERLSDDKIAAELWAEASEFPSVTWKSVVQVVANWLIAKNVARTPMAFSPM